MNYRKQKKLLTKQKNLVSTRLDANPFDGIAQVIYNLCVRKLIELKERK